MVDRVDFTPDPAAPAAPEPVVENQGADRPAWLPAEFKTVEDFTQSYAATKAELTRKSQELASLRKEPSTTEDPPADPPKDPKPTPPKTAEGKQLEIEDTPIEDKAPAPSMEDFMPYQQEFISTGDVVPENREKIAEKLKPMFGDMALAVVNDYIEGSKVRRDNTTRELMDTAGGAEQYQSMMAWAKDNLSAAEKEAYNKQVNSGDVHSAKFAIEGLRAKFEKVNGREPTLLTGDPSALSSTTAPFKSLQDMTAAMKDPRYKLNNAEGAAYRKQVQQRVAISNI